MHNIKAHPKTNTKDESTGFLIETMQAHILSPAVLS